MVQEALFTEIYNFLQSFAVVHGEPILEYSLYFVGCFEIEYLLIGLRVILDILEVLYDCLDFLNLSWLPAFIKQVLHRFLVGYHHLYILFVICRFLLFLLLLQPFNILIHRIHFFFQFLRLVV